VTRQCFGASAYTENGCDDGPVGQGIVTRSCSVTTTAPPIFSSGDVSETVKHDSLAPVGKVLVARFSTNPDVTSGLNDKLTAAAKAKTAAQRAQLLSAFANQVRAQTGKALTAEQAGILLELAEALA
jgi:hypothetical protein